MFFVNRESGYSHETVDQYESRKEAEKAQTNYQAIDFGRAFYCVSRTPRSNWILISD